MWKKDAGKVEKNKKKNKSGGENAKIKSIIAGRLEGRRKKFNTVDKFYIE